MSLWLSDPEVDDLCDGLRTNAAKTRALRNMGLTVRQKPNGRPLVVRSHAEAVLSGLQQLQAQFTPVREKPQPNREALILAFGRKRRAA